MGCHGEMDIAQHNAHASMVTAALFMASQREPVQKSGNK